MVNVYQFWRGVWVDIFFFINYVFNSFDQVFIERYFLDGFVEYGVSFLLFCIKKVENVLGEQQDKVKIL